MYIVHGMYTCRANTPNASLLWHATHQPTHLARQPEGHREFAPTSEIDLHIPQCCGFLQSENRICTKELMCFDCPLL